MDENIKLENDPAFLVAGGAKCGATSLYFYLRAHPQIYAPTKEVCFLMPESTRKTNYKWHILARGEYADLFDTDPEKHITDVIGKLRRNNLQKHPMPAEVREKIRARWVMPEPEKGSD